MKFFIKCSIRNFTSSTKERFKKIIEYSEPHSLFKKKDDTLFQMLCFSLEKQNLTKFNEVYLNFIRLWIYTKFTIIL